MTETTMSAKEIEYWRKEGPKTAAFLLIIPGLTLFGGAIGWDMGRPLPFGAMGLGLGMTVWGLIVVFRKSEPKPE